MMNVGRKEGSMYRGHKPSSIVGIPERVRAGSMRRALPFRIFFLVSLLHFMPICFHSMILCPGQ